MSVFLAELASIEILTEQAAAGLRRYIAEKNPSLPPRLKAGIFADAVNRILNDRLPRLPEEQIKALKANLFKATAGKQAFCINGSDIFKAALKLKTLGYSFFSGLNQWLEETLHRPVAREKVFELVLRTRQMMDAYPEMDIGDILEIIEEKPAVKVPESREEACMPAVVEAECETDAPVDPLPDIHVEKPYTDFPTLLAGWKKFAAAAACIAIISLSLLYFSGTYANAARTAGTAGGDETASSMAAGLLLMEDTPASGMEVPPDSTTIKMKATAYDLSFESCGKRRGHPLYGITFSGTKASAGRTIAVDPAVIPLGSSVKITFPEKYSNMDGVYIAEDTGRLIKGNHIDIFFGEDKPGSTVVNQRALKFGVQYVEVEIKK